MREWVLDLETDALFNYTAIWVAVLRNVKTNQTKIFRYCHKHPEPLRQFIADNVDILIGHNIIRFDNEVLKHFRITLPESVRLYDTLVVSQLLNYRMKGGHSLENWGEFFKSPKVLFNDYSKWSLELEERCIQDTLLTSRLYNYFKKYSSKEQWRSAIELEHSVSFLCVSLQTNGFCYNLEYGKELEKELEKKVEDILAELQAAFPPKSVPLREITPVLTKQGTLHAKDFRWLADKDLTPFSADAPFSLFEYVSFNPRSTTQRMDVLNAAGWKPINKTKGHIKAEREGAPEEVLARFKRYGWVTDDENLDTLPDDAPEAARKLKEFLLLSSRLEDLQEWNGLVDPVSGRIHGTFNGIGSWTHRKSHTKPNMANIPALINRHGKPQPYGKEMRSLWVAPKGRVLVGCDAEGIQLRVFAHYCNDLKLIEAIINGKKEEKTDIHSLNKSILGTICNSREVAKTYIYALLLGAGFGKQASILGCSMSEAKRGLERILEFYPGWKRLKETQIRQDADRGYFVGLDGRLVMVPSEHHVLAGYLQNGESVVMKRASLLWHRVLQQNKISFKFVDDVHDEWQTETDPDVADFVGQTQTEAITKVGIELGLNCPLAGKYAIGSNWAETH
jgi:DNA polymerase-1